MGFFREPVGALIVAAYGSNPAPAMQGKSDIVLLQSIVGVGLGDVGLHPRVKGFAEARHDK